MNKRMIQPRNNSLGDDWIGRVPAGCTAGVLLMLLTFDLTELVNYPAWIVDLGTSQTQYGKGSCI